jgi:erythromycin esterase
MTERAFHDAILEGGAMPIAMVRARLMKTALRSRWRKRRCVAICRAVAAANPVGRRQVNRCARAIALAIVTLCASTPRIVLAQSEAFSTWAAAHAIPLRTVEPVGDRSDLAPLHGLVGSARVVAIGEPTHGAHEPLALRNRLVQYLVEHESFTAVGIESGFSESGSVARYVAGGNGDAASVTRDGLTWGFGNFAENVELIAWLRAWNADPTHTRKVHFYSFDLSGAANGAFPNPRRSVDSVLAYLAHADSAAARGAHESLDPYLGRFSTYQYASLSASDRAQLDAGLARLATALRTAQRSLVAASSDEEYAWMFHRVIVAQQVKRMFDVSPPPSPSPDIPPDAYLEVQARDSGMAENVRWALEREGASGRLVIFAHNGHVANASVEGGIWSAFRQPPSAMGMYLRSMLGRDLLVIGGTSGVAPTVKDSVEVDGALSRVGVPRFLLDLRSADGAALRWLSARTHHSCERDDGADPHGSVGVRCDLLR